MISFTPETLTEMPAQELQVLAGKLDKAADLTFCQIGLICCHMDESRKWAELGYRKFTAWLEDSFKRFNAYEAFRVMGALLPTVPWAEMCEMKRCNLITMADKCSTAVQKTPRCGKRRRVQARSLWSRQTRNTISFWSLATSSTLRR